MKSGPGGTLVYPASLYHPVYTTTLHHPGYTIPPAGHPGHGTRQHRQASRAPLTRTVAEGGVTDAGVTVVREEEVQNHSLKQGSLEERARA